MSNKKKRILIAVVLIAIAIPLIVNPIATVIIYEAIFSSRYETEEWLKYSDADFPGLSSERVEFENSENIPLCGYKYYYKKQNVRGVVIISHGLGGGGHEQYMPFVNAFAKADYLVFAYDATGNGESGGGSVRGLPEGIIDLDAAISYIKQDADCKKLPIALFGHSWGAYSAGAVLGLHPDIDAAVIMAGFNESKDMLRQYSSRYVGPFSELLLPTVSLYERIKFGDYAELSVQDGIRKSDAGVLVVHSMDDTTVEPERGFKLLLSEFKNEERVEFISYETRGHSYLFFSPESEERRKELNRQYESYVESNNLEYSREVKAEFMEQFLDKSLCFEPDPALMENILSLFEEYCK